MSGVFRNIGPPPASVYPPPLVRGEDILAGWKGGGGSIVRKTPDTALYSIYVSTLCSTVYAAFLRISRLRYKACTEIDR
jgi:hypothetical protein